MAGFSRPLWTMVSMTLTMLLLLQIWEPASGETLPTPNRPGGIGDDPPRPDTGRGRPGPRPDQGRFSNYNRPTINVDTVGNTSRIISMLQKYGDTRIRPYDSTGQPVNVSVSVRVIHVRAVSEENTELSVELYFRRFWHDPRLEYRYGPDIITVPSGPTEQLFWVPDLFVSNAIEVKLHEGLQPHYGFIINSNGNVLLSSKLTLRLACFMDLRSFPFDIQSCPIKIESYMYTNDQLGVQWNDSNSVTTNTSRHPPRFTFLGLSMSKNTEDRFEELVVDLKLRRLCTHYILLTYLPSVLLVVLCCLLFWMPLTCLAERAIYGSFLFLGMVVVLASSQYSTPHVGYAKALDVWVSACILFVFAAVMETMILHLLTRWIPETGSQAHRTDQFELMKEDELSKGEQPRIPGTGYVGRGRLRRVDFALRLLYPASFVLFNAIYWAAYAQ